MNRIAKAQKEAIKALKILKEEANRQNKHSFTEAIDDSISTVELVGDSLDQSQDFHIGKTPAILVLAVGLFASACAPKVWVRDGLTQDQFNKDRAECLQSASAMGAGNPLIQNSEFKYCMKSRGYSLEVQ